MLKATYDSLNCCIPRLGSTVQNRMTKRKRLFGGDVWRSWMVSFGHQRISDGDGGIMRRERALKFVLVLVGLLFSALVYPLMMFVRQEPALAMMLSLYVTLGIFLLLATGNPSANRSLIAFTAWSSFAHAAVMGMQAFRNLIPRGELVGVAALVVIGVALIVLAPSKQSTQRASAVSA